ncbi:sensor histidine kinase [Leisingera sp. D0M16]|uniref:sensor histidine kinase n=1 Tax=Leisingera coralii TaxID=3351347 RepID=UPI003B7677D9
MQTLLEFEQYMPHGMCLLWEPWLLVLWAGSDLLIFLAYFAIPLALLRVLRQRKDIKHRGLVLLFASFILLCGLTHAVSIVTLWWPVYPAQGLVKLATALVSATTAVVLFRLVPVLVAIPSRRDLEHANSRLLDEVAAHEATLDVLRQARHDLEMQVEERTAELKDVNAKLAVTAREAVHRSHNMIAVVSSMARQSARGVSDVDDFVGIFTGRLNALASATQTVMQEPSGASADLGSVIRAQLEPVLLSFGDRMTVEGPDVTTGSEAAQQISLALHELATNAQKYGSADGEEARISVSWSVRGENSSQKRLRLRWEEDISRQSDMPVNGTGRTGFGTRLLTQIVPSMLQGEASRTVEGGKLVYELDIPLSALAEGESQAENAQLASRIVGQGFGIA